MGILLLAVAMCFVIALAIGIVSAIVYWNEDSLRGILIMVACVFVFIIGTCELIKYIPVFHI